MGGTPKVLSKLEMESDSLGADRRQSRIKGSSLVQVEDVHYARREAFRLRKLRIYRLPHYHKISHNRQNKNPYLVVPIQDMLNRFLPFLYLRSHKIIMVKTYFM